MAQGFCSVCGRRLPIVSRGYKPEGRQQYWYPVKHPQLGDDTGGKDCPGMLKPI